MSATAHRLLVVSPVRNEAAHIDRVVRAMAAQRQPPTRWIVIDDRSTDRTLQVLRRLEAEVPFMEVHEAHAETAPTFTRDRLARAAAPRNFNRGLAQADWREYDYVMKLDGDIELAPGYLQTVIERMQADASIGIAGGYLDEPQPDGGLARIPIPSHHVHGALKLYTRDCFASIGGMQERLAWDTIDETYARMHGYRTVSFRDLVSVHHRPWGTADGAIRGRTRLGQCAYITHYPPLWVLLRSLKLSLQRPRGVLGAAYLYGYTRAFVTRTERVDDRRYRRFARGELHRRMARAAIPPPLRVAGE
ncbi:MAG TPA: glycosyltransferase [Solirubrobacteraceae bacterium]|nr:glycosyltransferase [Solirubrobacteraceae bacterium]